MQKKPIGQPKPLVPVFFSAVELVSLEQILPSLLGNKAPDTFFWILGFWL